MKDKLRKSRRNLKLGLISRPAYLSQLVFILWSYGKGKNISLGHFLQIRTVY